MYQGLEEKTGHGGFGTKGAPKEIEPIMAVTTVTSPTSQTSIGIEKGGVETITNSARVKQNPSNEKPTRGETRAEMDLDRMKGATSIIRARTRRDKTLGTFTRPQMLL